MVRNIRGSKLIVLLLAALAGVQGCATGSGTQQHARARNAKATKHDDGLGDASGGTVLAVSHSLRQVSMYYRLDLRQDNRYAQAVAAVMDANDAQVRSCYLTRLERDPAAKGDVVFAFQLYHVTGTMQNITRLSSTQPDARFEKCLQDRLAAVSFKLPANLRGTVAYSFTSTIHGVVVPVRHLAGQ